MSATGSVTPSPKPGFDRTALVEALLPPLLALLIALVLGDLLILAFGQSPAMVYRLLIDGTWGNPYGLGQVLYKATTLSFTGLAVAVGLRAGLFNIGAESQLAAGAFAAAIAGLALPHGTPWLLAVPLCLAAAAFGGALVGALAGFLKARFGYDLRAAGLQPDAAEAGGIKVNRVWVSAMALAGALAGLGGTNFVLGYKGYYEDGLAGGAGFMGIAVALVGRNHPFGVLLASLLFATLSQGGLAIHAAVPKQLVEVLQATVILAMAATAPEVRRLLRNAVLPRRGTASAGRAGGSGSGA